ncbi:hypothetical protein F0L74_06025 [Chitinophaga agrisoli]|uniref:Uncharacterized protein n=1 Tax=Chitinophaga agrisoli TaxID=2607653 RepID=A0A5B2W323_9BACT|nr:hypothetical protein [Chitinophaga agrisoli]KAA2245514.1 hypothetical protein F0L74_06025 [Chitinophaga agrisoli]
MKTTIVLFSLFVASACYGQHVTPAFSLTAGSDFRAGLTSLGIEGGIYTTNRKHSFMATLEADRIDNADLLKYGHPELVHPEITNSVSSHTVGLKYNMRVLNAAPVSLYAVVQPWYSINLNIPSAWAGGRVTWTRKGDMVSVEVMRDVRCNRYAIRLVFTTFKKHN